MRGKGRGGRDKPPHREILDPLLTAEASYENLTNQSKLFDTKLQHWLLFVCHLAILEGFNGSL